jgi:hypothetical protein
MKRMAIGLAAALVVAFFTAAHVNAAETYSVVGQWEAVGIANGKVVHVNMNLKANGDYDVSVDEVLGGPVGSFSGTYTYFFGVLTLKTPDGKDIVFNMKWVDRDTFTEGGDTYTRIK